MVVYLVGSGPGDVELLTLKAFRLIGGADVLIYDNLVNKKILEYTLPSCRKIYVGKVSGRHHKTQEEINRIIVKYGRQFDTVVRLKGGDPYIFGRGGEEAEILHDNGIRFEVVPGISSAVAAPMYAGIPLSHRNYNCSFAVLTGHRAKDKDMIKWDKLPDVLVILMGVSNLTDNVKNLIDAGYPEDTPVAGIYRGTTFEQRLIKTTLRELPSKKLMSPMIFVVGSVVELSDKLNWFGHKIGMLKGKRVAITRKLTGHVRKIFSELNADVIEIPLLDLKKIKFELPDLNEFDIIVFTSVNGVSTVMDRVDLGRHRDKVFYAIGPKTRDILSKSGINPHIPKRYNSESLADFMLSNTKGKKRILLLRSTRASPVLMKMLSKRHDVEEIHVYDIEDKKSDLSKFQKSDIIFITSSSAARIYCGTHTEDKGRNRIVVSIGQMTSKTLRDNGIREHIEAVESTIEGMILSTIEYLWKMDKNLNQNLVENGCKVSEK